LRGSRGRAGGIWIVAALVVGAGVPAVVGAEGAQAPVAANPLIGVSTPRQGETRGTVPITRRKGADPKTVLSLPLPRLKQGDLVRFNGEVTVTTTCVEALPRCVGRRYKFDPRLRAWIELADGAKAGGGRRVSGRVALRCQQTRPNRNHHCPLVAAGSMRVRSAGRLPCSPSGCRLNMVVSAHHRRARGGEVVVIGADRPDGSIEGGKGRLSAAVARAGRGVEAVARRTTRRRTRALPASFSGGQRVVYSQRIPGLGPGDVLLARATQRTAIEELPYFVASKIVVSARPNARRPGPLARRIVSRRGTATETNGFNCTLGPSAFRSPCRTRKAGLAVVQQTPRDARGRRRPLFVNLVSRTFPKRAQARLARYPPARILGGGELTVTHLRAR
jgi:hypothetical protein